jgi:hypothetical protein
MLRASADVVLTWRTTTPRPSEHWLTDQLKIGVNDNVPEHTHAAKNGWGRISIVASPGGGDMSCQPCVTFSL